MVFWVTSQHCCSVEKRSLRLTDNDFQKQTKPRSWRNAFALKKNVHVHPHSHAVKEVIELCFTRWWYLAKHMDKGDPWLPPPCCNEKNRQDIAGVQQWSPRAACISRPTMDSYNFVWTDELILLDIIVRALSQWCPRACSLDLSIYIAPSSQPTPYHPSFQKPLSL